MVADIGGGDSRPALLSTAHRRADLHPLDDTSGKIVKSVSEGRSGREEEAFYGAANHRVFEGSGSRCSGEGVVPQARL